MKTISITLTDGEFAALELEVVDAVDWVMCVVKAKVLSIEHKLKHTPEWIDVVASAADAGIDIHDAEATILYGLGQGILTKAAGRVVLQVSDVIEIETGLE